MNIIIRTIIELRTINIDHTTIMILFDIIRNMRLTEATEHKGGGDPGPPPPTGWGIGIHLLFNRGEKRGDHPYGVGRGYKGHIYIDYDPLRGWILISILIPISKYIYRFRSI